MTNICKQSMTYICKIISCKTPTRHKLRSNHNLVPVILRGFRKHVTHPCGQTIHVGHALTLEQSSKINQSSRMITSRNLSVQRAFDQVFLWNLCNVKYNLLTIKCNLNSRYTQKSSSSLHYFQYFLFLFSLLFFICSDPLQRLNLSPPVKAHAFVTLGKLHQPKE